MFSDDSYIYFDGFANNQICHNLNSERQVPVINFEDANSGNARTVPSEAFIEMLSDVLNVDICPEVWFHQNGACVFV